MSGPSLETVSPVNIDNGVTFRLPQFVNIVSRLVGEKDISEQVRNEVGEAIGNVLPNYVQTACSLVGTDGRINIKTNDERTMYRLETVANTAMKDLIPQISTETKNGESNVTIDDLLIINLGTGEHHGGRSRIAAEITFMYEYVKASLYERLSLDNPERIISFDRYAAIAGKIGGEVGTIDNIGSAIKWASPDRIKSHELAMEKMEEWFGQNMKDKNLVEKFGFRTLFSMWKLVQDRATLKMMNTANSSIFDRNGDIREDTKMMLDNFENNSKALGVLDTVMKDFPGFEL